MNSKSDGRSRALFRFLRPRSRLRRWPKRRNDDSCETLPSRALHENPQHGGNRMSSMTSYASALFRLRHADNGTQDLAHAHKGAILFTMCLGVFVAQLDSSVVNLAVKHIGGDLNAGVNQLQWVVDSYNLVYATLLLTGGTLGDLYGRTRIFVLGIGLIAVGSLVCALAPNAAILIAGRAVTGLGAALELPTTLAILTVTYADPKERGRAIGIWASLNGVALAVGPTIGGLLVDLVGWRSIFLLVVPVTLLALVMALK